MELYHWKPAATSARVLICLHEKGLPYSGHYVDLLSHEQFSDDALSINPFGQVPVLVVDGRPLYESVVINEYLEEAYPEIALAPRDPKGWYDQQGWTKFLDYNLTTSVSTLGWWQQTRPALGADRLATLQSGVDAIAVTERRDAWRQALADAPAADQLDNSRRKIELVVKRMESALAVGPYLLGEDFSLVDIAAWPLAQCLPGLAPELVSEKTSPHVCAWLECVAERPAVKSAMSITVPDDGLPGFAPGPEHSRWG